MGLLKGRTAIVTGATGGLGGAICEDIVAEEGDLVLTYHRNRIKAEELAHYLRRYGRKIMVVHCDFLNSLDVTALVKKSLKTMGKVDILVNNAGIMKPSNPFRVTRKMWEQAIEVNLLGPYFLTSAIGLLMMKNGYGRIVNMASTTGLIGSASDITYSPTKAALIGLTKSFAIAFGDSGVTVNAIAASTIDEGMFRTLPPERRQEVIDGVPLRRSGSPRELAFHVLHFICERAGFTTGQVLTVDGGRVRH